MSSKILVLGNSVGFMVVPERPDRTNGNFGDMTETFLRDGGIDARVVNRCRWYELIGHGAKRWREELRQVTPDVVVVVYGTIECQPNVLPTWLSRHFMTWDRGTTRLRGLYRNRVAPAVWPRLRSYQRLAASIDKQSTWRLPPKRFHTELRELVAMIREEQALVLVVDVPPFGPTHEHFLPGLDERRRVFQAVIDDVVASSGDPDVRVVRASAVVEELGAAIALPDGLHLSPLGHRRVAELITGEVTRFLARDDVAVS